MQKARVDTHIVDKDEEYLYYTRKIENQPNNVKLATLKISIEKKQNFMQLVHVLFQFFLGRTE